MNNKTLIVVGSSLVLLIAIVGYTLMRKDVAKENITREGYYTVYGYLYDAGLEHSDTDFQTAKLSSKTAVQVTNINYEDSQMNHDTVYGYFLNTSYDGAKKYLGTCVEVIGKPVEVFDAANNTPTLYGRKSLADVTINSSTKCSLSSLVQNANPSQQNGAEITLKGKITLVQRPSPDIAYDYSMALTTPYSSQMSMGGSTQAVNSVIVMAGNEVVAAQLLKIGNKSVTISGYFEWGYAESNYFVIYKLVD